MDFDSQGSTTSVFCQRFLRFCKKIFWLPWQANGNQWTDNGISTILKAHHELT
jgi:hypothetical protein